MKFFMDVNSLKVLILLLCVLGCSQDAVPIRRETAPSFYGLKFQQDLMIPVARHARRKGLSIKPKYITVHSTQNRHSSANARKHAVALFHGRLKSKNNSLGYLSWHYSVDESKIYQHLPDLEEGQHADYEGQGNKASIGIEMCENAGNSREKTLDHTARLIAYLMRKYAIPLENVVPHQHWRRIRYSDGKDLGHKNCPHFLMDQGKPGEKWAVFLAQVNKYSSRTKPVVKN